MNKYIVFLVLLIFVGCTPKNNEIPNKISINTAFIVNGGDNSLSVLNLNTLQMQLPKYLKNVNNAFAHHIYISKDKRQLTIGLPEYDFSLGHSELNNSKLGGKIGVIDPEIADLVKIIDVKTIIHDAIVAPDGNTIWTTLFGTSGKISIFDQATGQKTNDLFIGKEPSELTFGFNEKYAAIASEESSFLTIIDVKDKKIIKEIKVDPFPTGVFKGFDDNSVFVINSFAKSLNVIDFNTLKVVDFIDFNFKPGYTAFNNTTKELWVCEYSGTKVSVFFRENSIWKLKKEILTDNDPHHISFANNETVSLILNQKSNTLQIFDSKNYTKLKSFKTGKKPNGIAIWD